MIGNPSDHAFGKVDVQVVGDDVPFGLVRRAGDQPIEEAGEVVFGASRPDDTAHLAGGDIETGDQGLGTMADVLVFPSFDQARLERQRRGCALERLDAGHLVDRDGANPVVRSLPRTGVGRADVGALVIEPLIRLGRQPIPDAMRLQRRLF